MRLAETPPRLITRGSKFPVNRLYNTQAILLKEEAIQLCPTFHLRLTFTSPIQFYHSDCNVSADAILPCYRLNRAGLIISSQRARVLLCKDPYPASLATRAHYLGFHVVPNRGIFLFFFYFPTPDRSAPFETGHLWLPKPTKKVNPWCRGKDRRSRTYINKQIVRTALTRVKLFLWSRQDDHTIRIDGARSLNEKWSYLTCL